MFSECVGESNLFGDANIARFGAGRNGGMGIGEVDRGGGLKVFSS